MLSLPTIPWFRWLGILAIALGCLWVAFGAKSCLGNRQAAVAIQKADQLDTSQKAHGAEAVNHEQEAAGLKPLIQQDEATTTGDDAAVERDRTTLQAVRARGRKVDPAAPANAPEPAPSPVELAAVDAAKDQLIADLTKDLADTKKSLADLRIQNADLALGDLARRAQVKDLQAVEVQLRAALAAKEGVLRAQRWMGRLEGFAVGFGGGYLTKGLR